MEIKNKHILAVALGTIFTMIYLNINNNNNDDDSTKLTNNFTSEKNNNSIRNDNKLAYVINNIQPEISYNSNAKIVFVYVYTSNIYSYSQHSIKNLLAYVKKYNYGAMIYNKPFNDEVSPCWNKIASIITNLKNLSKCKYLVWIDADAIITNFSISTSSFVEKNPGYDLYICEDILKEVECVNSGVMIIKNTSWSYNLFKKVWNSNIPHKHNDQNVIWNEIIKEKYPQTRTRLKYPMYCSNLNHPKVLVLKENEFNSNIYSYKPGDFILHLMGAKEKCRINIMRQINTKLKLDNYNNTDCINIIEGKNKTKKNKFKLIKEICLEQ